MRPSSVAPRLCLALTLLGSGNAAKALSLNDLAGRSVIATYDEMVTTGQGKRFRQIWQNRIYFSTKGRIFNQFNRTTSQPGRSRAAESVSDAAGAGEGSEARFTWTGQGVTRQWMNAGGRVMRQTITIVPSGDGYRCSMTLERLSVHGSSQVRQDCRVVRGNAVGGR